MSEVRTYAEALKEAMQEEMRSNPSVFLMGEEVGRYGGVFSVSEGMLEEFGCERVRDTPISEAAIVGAATGAALLGMRPIVDLGFSDFVGVSMDQIVNQAAKICYQSGGQGSVPLVIRLASGSGTGAGAQHSQSLEAWFCHVPGLKVVVPATPYDAKGLLKSAVRDDNPVLFFEQKTLYKIKGQVPREAYTISLGKARTVIEGDDISIITYGRMVHKAQEAAGLLSSRGIHAEILDLRTLNPLDKQAILETLKKTGRALVVHEGCQFGGFGGEIASFIAGPELFSHLKGPIQRLGGAFTPIPVSKTLEETVVPNTQQIVETVSAMLKG